MTTRDLLREAEEKMHKTVEATHRELSTVRTGRASPNLVEGVKVSYYDTQTPVKQLATITTPDPRTIVIQPWDAAVLGEIERALLEANIGITPTNDGHVIRLSIPQPTKERREELAKLVRKMAEEGRISIRTGRHHTIEQIRKLGKDRAVSEDDAFTSQEEVQKLTDKFIAKIDEMLKQKEKEVLDF